MSGTGGPKRAPNDELDLTESEDPRERMPTGRADVELMVLGGRGLKLVVLLRDRLGLTADAVNHALRMFATGAALVGPMLGWLTVCLVADAPATLTVWTCAGVLVLSATTVLLVQPRPVRREQRPTATGPELDARPGKVPTHQRDVPRRSSRRRPRGGRG